MPSLNYGEVERLRYAFRYIQQYGLCGEEDNVYNYFGFNEEYKRSIWNLWFAQYDLNSYQSTYDNYSQSVSLGLPFGGMVVERRPERIFINRAIDRISDHEFERRYNLFWGMGLKTSQDRLMIFSKILETLYELSIEEEPSKRLIALINVCNSLARDTKQNFQTHQSNNFKTVLQGIRDDIFISLGDMTALQLGRTYAAVAEDAFDFADRINQLLRYKYGMKSDQFSKSWEQLKNSYQVSKANGSETVTTQISQVCNALKELAEQLKIERDLANSIYEEHINLTWWDVYRHINGSGTEKERIWKQLTKSLESYSNSTSHAATRQQLNEYLDDLNDAVYEIESRIDVINVMPKVNVPQSLNERIQPVEEVLDELKIKGNLPKPLGDAYLEPSDPKNPFFRKFSKASAHRVSRNQKEESQEAIEIFERPFYFEYEEASQDKLSHSA